MKKLNVMGLDFTYKAKIASFDSAIVTRNWNGVDVLTFSVNSEIINADLIDIDDVVWFDTDYHKGFIIERKEEKLTGNNISYNFTALGLTSLLRDFITVPADASYDIATGTREYVVRQWVTTNCIARNSQYPIVLGTYNTLGSSITDQTRYTNLLDEIKRVLEPDDLGFNLTIDLDEEEFVFNVEEGTDRTVNAATYEPRVIFGVQYGNLSEYQKINDTVSTKNYAFVGGSGEDSARVIQTVDTSTDRIKEVFINANDLTDLDDLTERGTQSLAETAPVDSFDFTVIDRQFIYETNYDLGDYVTVVKSTTDYQDLQIKKVQEIYEKGNIKVIPSFGITDRTLNGVLSNVYKRLSLLETVTTIPVIPLLVEYLVIGGGGAGRGNGALGNSGDGGSAGEYLSSSKIMELLTNYTVTVGDGGAGWANAAGAPGEDSVFDTIIADGGLGGQDASNSVARSGGDGAGEDGDAGVGNYAGDGGDGLENSISGVATYYAGGGGGGFTFGGAGGTGGGGHGESYSSGGATAGTANTGSGGGGRSNAGSTPGMAGGSGIVIIKFPKAYTLTVGAGLTSSNITSGDYKIYTFTAGTGTISFS